MSGPDRAEAPRSDQVPTTHLAAAGAGGSAPLSAPGPASPARFRWAALTWGVAALYLVSLFDRGWIPHDEGTLGQTAWRILLGEVPHRDFDALYTGLLGYLNAAAMAVLGTHLLAPRIVLLLAVLAWVAIVWSLASRFVEPPLAAAATLLCVTIGPGVYPAAMPSWYNLFLATGGLWALIRWTEDARTRWLLVTGALAGLSALFKVTGLYFLAAALFTVLHVETGRAARGAKRGGAGALPALLLAMPLAVLVAMVVALVRSQLGALTTVVHYVLPILALASLAGWEAWNTGAGSRAVLVRVGRAWAPIVGAFMAPVALYVALFVTAGAADDLYRGVFVLPTRRLVTAAGTHLPLPMTAGILLPLALVGLEGRLAPALRAWTAVAVGLAGVALLALSDAPSLYRAFWFSLHVLVPVAVLGGAWAAYRPAATGPVSRRTEGPPPAVLAVLWTAALTSLLQFPLAGPIYFAHVAPMGVLAAIAAVGAAAGAGASGRANLERTGAERAGPEGSELERAVPESGASPAEGTRAPFLGRRPVLLALVLVHTVFLASGPNRSGLFGPPPAAAPVRLPLERGRIRVPPAHAEEYARLVAALRELSRSEWIYATPDAPEVYFLSGFRNPTRTLFEIFDDPDAVDRIPDTLERLGVNVVVFNTGAEFSPPPVALAGELESAYPRGARIGRFIVRWR